jgi:hypothetical protein
MVEGTYDVTEMIYECVNYLRADEPGTAEGSSDKFVKDAYMKPSRAKQVGTSASSSMQDFDDID